MKQKIVIGLRNGDKKCSSKAMKIVATVSGVESMTVGGENKNQITITGDGTDAVELAKSLRKKLGFAEIVSVEPITEKEKEKEKEKTEPTIQQYTAWPMCQPIWWQHY